MGTVKDTVKRDWYLINAEGKTLGRLATKIAGILQGKHKAAYSQNIDQGDFVIVVNAEKVRVTGNKHLQKKYFHHSGYLGGLTTVTYKEMMDKHPERIIEHAVSGMLPKNKLRDVRKTRLKVYKGDKHDHKAQKPVVLE